MPTNVQLRKLSPQQVERLSTLLRDKPGQSVAFEFVSRDPEATQYLAQLITVFQTSGWTVESLAEIDDPNLSGSTIVVKNLADTPPWLRRLVDEFTWLGIAVTTTSDKDHPPERITLRIGHQR